MCSPEPFTRVHIKFLAKESGRGRSGVKFRVESEENYGARGESPAGGSEGHL
jgi:hypothetical protein